MGQWLALQCSPKLPNDGFFTPKFLEIWLSPPHFWLHPVILQNYLYFLFRWGYQLPFLNPTDLNCDGNIAAAYCVFLDPSDFTRGEFYPPSACLSGYCDNRCVHVFVTWRMHKEQLAYNTGYFRYDTCGYYGNRMLKIIGCKYGSSIHNYELLAGQCQ